MSKKANYMYLPSADLEIDLRNDTATEDKVLEGYTFHKANGEIAVGTATSGGGDVDYYTVILDCDIEPTEIQATPLETTYFDGYRDYSTLAIASGDGKVLKVPANTVLRCNWQYLYSAGISHSIYINEEQVATVGDYPEAVIRGEAGQTYTIELNIAWEELDSPTTISASDCEFNNGVLTKVNFNGTVPNNIVLPASYNMTSQSYNVDCRTNNIGYSSSLMEYVQSNNIPFPFSISDGNTTYTINSENDFFSNYYYDIDQLFINALQQDPDNWTITLSYTINSYSDGNDYTVDGVGDGINAIFAYSDANKIRKITIPNSVEEINDGAFNGCYYVREYVLSSNLTKIGNLIGCYESLTIPASVQEVGNLMGNFTSLTIPSNVETLGNITDCWKLETLTFAQNSLQNQSSLSVQYCYNLQSIQGLSNTPITYFDNFYGLPSLKKIDSNTDGEFVLTNIEYVGESHFASFGRHITSLTLSAITEVSGSFGYCFNIEHLTLPATLTQISDIILSLGASETTLTFLSTTPPDLYGAEPLVDGKSLVNPNLVAIYVPSANVNDYKEGTNWSVYASLIQAIQ